MIGLTNYGFVRVGSAVPEMKVADCIFNTEKILELMEKAAEQKVYITVFPSFASPGTPVGTFWSAPAFKCRFGCSGEIKAGLFKVE